ncbi:MAG: RT0821/Lpp0805 family surface protein [Motiliproteus sp.]
MKPLLLITGLGLSLSLIGCQGTLQNNKMATATPAPLYSRLTDEDTQKADQALQQALETLPSAQKQHWENSNSGNSGTLIPLRSYKSVAGYYCREYRELVRIRQRQAVYFDTACRSKNGNWYPI